MKALIVICLLLALAFMFGVEINEVHGIGISSEGFDSFINDEIVAPVKELVKSFGEKLVEFGES